ncbi:MAG: hypothetical protein KGL78_04740 [Burkholderiales bacterium]|nr:hypothetical protein [Burkholderiales bacterium]
MIEVLAAMVIFSAGATVLFGWIGQTSERLALLAREQRELFSDMAALEYMKTVNPMLDPAGEVRLADGVRLIWQSERLPGDDTVRRPDSLYELGLYRVKVRVAAPQQPVRESSVQLAGWRQVRQPSAQGPIRAAAGT